MVALFPFAVVQRYFRSWRLNLLTETVLQIFKRRSVLLVVGSYHACNGSAETPELRVRWCSAKLDYRWKPHLPRQRRLPNLHRV